MLHDPKFETKIKARAILSAAADYLEIHEWCQGALKFKDRVCMIGAVIAASDGELTGFDPVSSEVMGRLRRATNSNIADWNDKPGRTKKQVIAALRRASR